MAYGVCLGILLICLVQAEHVCCLWATQAQSSQSQNGNSYVGFSQQDGRSSSSYPQNEFRQASVRSLGAGTAANGGYHHGLSTKMYSHAHQSSVKIAQSSSLSKPNWRISKFTGSSQKRPFLGLSTDIASGSSLSKRNGVAHVKPGTPRTSKYLPSSSASVQSPSREGFHSNRRVAQKPPTAAKAPAYYGQAGSSRLFSRAGPAPLHRPSVQMQTSASAPARRMSTRRAAEQSKPSPQTTYTQIGARKPHRSSLFPSYSPASSNHQATRSRNAAQGARHIPSSTRSTVGTSGKKFAPTQTHKIPQHFGGYAIRRLKEPADQKNQTPTPAPQQAVTYTTQGQSVHQGAYWRRLKLHQGR